MVQDCEEGLKRPNTEGMPDDIMSFIYQQEPVEPETYYSNVTCNTQAFSYPLLTSTPFVGQLKQPHGRTESPVKTCCQ